MESTAGRLDQLLLQCDSDQQSKRPQRALRPSNAIRTIWPARAGPQPLRLNSFRHDRRMMAPMAATAADSNRAAKPEGVAAAALAQEASAQEASEQEASEQEASEREASEREASEREASEREASAPVVAEREASAQAGPVFSSLASSSVRPSWLLSLPASWPFSWKSSSMISLTISSRIFLLRLFSWLSCSSLSSPFWPSWSSCCRRSKSIKRFKSSASARASNRSVQTWPRTACRPVEKLNRVNHRD
jgi:hypothetical protein